MCDSDSTAVETACPTAVPASSAATAAGPIRLKPSGGVAMPGDSPTSFAPFSSTGGAGSPSLPTGGQAVSPATLAEYQQRLQIYDYAQAALRFRLSHAASQYASLGGHPALSEIGSSFAATMSPFNRFDSRFRFMHEEPKPQHSYIGLIAMAILSSPEKKMVLSDIYQHILDNYPYFRNRGPGWRNSIRHNLSLNDCFVKAGRSANGKGHYWAIHPANIEDFKKGDFRRRKAQRKVRKHMGLSVPDDEDSNSPTPTPTPRSGPFDQPHHHLPSMPGPLHPLMAQGPPPSLCNNLASLQEMCLPFGGQFHKTAADRLLPFVQGYPGQHRDFVHLGGGLQGAQKQQPSNAKRLFDVESLLAPDSSSSSVLFDSAVDKSVTDQVVEKQIESPPQQRDQSSPLSSSLSPKELPDSNCSSPSASSDVTAMTPPPGESLNAAVDQQQQTNGTLHSLNHQHHQQQQQQPLHLQPHQLASGSTLASTWQAAHIQSLQNLHQINAGLVSQSLRPGFPMWPSNFGALPPSAGGLFGGYPLMTGSSSLSGNGARSMTNQKHQ